MKKHLLKSINFYLIGLIMLLSAGEVWGQCTTDADYTATAATPTCNNQTVTIQGPGHKTVVSGFTANRVYDLYLNSGTDNVNCVQAQWQDAVGTAIGGWFNISYANANPGSYTAVNAPANATKLAITTGKSNWEATSAVLNYRLKTPSGVSAGTEKTIACGANTQLTGSVSEGATYTYAWSPASSIVSGGTTLTPTVNPSSTTTYTLTATNGGCSAATSTVKVNVAGAPIVETVSAQTICSGESVGLSGGAYLPDEVVTPKAALNCYGTSNATDGDWILDTWTTGALVNFRNTMISWVNQTATGYADYSNQFTVVAKPNSSFNFNFTSGNYSNYNRVWVDWNNNGIFEVSESVFNNGSVSNYTTSTATINVPANQAPGEYRIRVRTVYNTNPGAGDACTNFSYGETEDYTLRVTNGNTPTATIFNADFNTTTGNNAFTTNSNGFVRNTTFNNGGENISSGGTYFYYLQSDGTGKPSPSWLQSPAFSTEDYLNPVLSFRHYFRQAKPDNNSRIYVQLSTDATNWTTIDLTQNNDNNSRIGAYNNFATFSVPLPLAFVDKPTVYVRFYYTHSNDWSWSIDDVKVVGELPGDPNITWTGSSIVSGATTITPVVNPTSTTTYTLNATVGACNVTKTSKVDVATTAPTDVTITTSPTAFPVCEGTNVTLTANQSTGGARYRLVLKSAYGTGWHGIQEIVGKNASGAQQTLTTIAASTATYADNPLTQGSYRATYAFDGNSTGTATSGIQWLTPEQSNATNTSGSNTLPNLNWKNYGTANPFPSPEWIEFSSPQKLSTLEVYNGRNDGNTTSCFKDYSIFVSYDNGATWHSLKTGTLTSTPRLNTISIEPTYTWKLGGTTVGTGKILTLNNITAAQGGTYSLEMQYGCSSKTITQAITVTPTPAQPSTITGTATVCSGTNNTYSVTNVAGVTYNWSYSGTGTISGSGNSISLNNITSSGTLTVTPSNSCGNGTARTLAITVTPTPAQPSTITGTATVCSGTNNTYSVTNVAGVTYNWTYTGTATISGSGNSRTLTNITSGGTLTVTPSNGCGNGAARTLAIAVNPNMTAGAASSTPTVCINTALTAITHTTTGVTSIGTATNLPAGVSANFASNTITISGTPTASGTFNYSIPLNGTCGTATATGTITVTAAPTPSFTSVSPTTNICEGTNVTYTTQSGKSNYTWTIPGVAGTDYTLVSGGNATSNTAVIAWKNANNAVVQVNYTDNGCVGASAANATAVTLPAPNSVLAGVDNQTCYVNGTNPVRFYGASSRNYIGSVNANGNDLGLVTMESFLNGVGYMEDCTDPANTSSWTTYMGRSWSLTSDNYTNSANFPSDVTVSLPFSDTEFSTMNTQAPSLTPNNPNDDGASLGDLMVTKVSNAAVKGAISQADCGNATILGIANSGTGSNVLGIASTHFVDVNVGQFSSFFVHKNNGTNSALPITLTSFAGNCDNGVQLSWVTASENNVSHYEIYRSRDGQAWELATTAEAVGNSSITNTYSATDNSGVETMYYRLRSVDNDGTYEDFAPISVVCNTESATWAVYPVPAVTTATVTITTPTASNDVMSIMDINGRIISQENIQIEAGVNNFQLDVRKLSEGTYFIHLKDNDGQLKPLKFLKIN